MLHTLNGELFPTAFYHFMKQRNVKSAQKTAYLSSNGSGENVTKQAFCTEAKLRFIGMFCGLLSMTFAVLYIGLAVQLPSEQAMSDSLYGCKTMRGLNEYANDADDGAATAATDDGNKNAMAANGDTVCGEVCIPISIYDQVMQGGGDGVSSLEYGTCSQDGYLCNYSSDAFDVGFIEIERELYTQGECAQQNGDTNEAS